MKTARFVAYAWRLLDSDFQENLPHVYPYTVEVYFLFQVQCPYLVRNRIATYRSSGSQDAAETVFCSASKVLLIIGRSQPRLHRL